MTGKVITTWSLVWLVAAVLFVTGGALNLIQRSGGALPPTDGVLWVQRADGVYAEKVIPGLAASRAGISTGDKLLTISLDGYQADEVASVRDIPIYLDAAGVGGSLTYLFERTSYTLADKRYIADLKIDTQPRWTPSIIFLTLVGLIWLGVGGFVLFKQGSRSPFVLHFATVCLAAFIFHVYRPLNLEQDLDLAIALLDDIAFAFFVPLFLHFCLRYPVRNAVLDRKPWKTVSLYIPAAILTIASLAFSLLPHIPIASVSEWMLDTLAQTKFWTRFNLVLLVHFVAGVSIGAALLIWRFASSKQTIVRQRLKWAMWGTVVSVIPILAFRIAAIFVYLPEDTLTVALTTLPLGLIPLSFGHSVVRYRLMDVDVVVRRALVYALTTLAISMMIGAVALVLVLLVRIDSDLSTTEITLRALIAVVAMAAIVLISEPLKKFLQDRANRYFYGERYDLRQGLLDFGRTLSAGTALVPLLDSLTERLTQVLDVTKVAVFIEDPEQPSRYVIARAIGLDEAYVIPADFKQMIREKSALTGVVRADELEQNAFGTADDSGHDTANGASVNGNGNGRPAVPGRQELHYFVPCVVRSKMVAVIGLGRAKDGSLLSSEDLDILRTVSGYVAVAIENSRLYQEQRQQTQELALLKEFNESIVESINVGLLAVDEHGTITRCNTTFEEMLQLGREKVVGKAIEDVFDSSFAANLMNILGRSRWHLTEIRNAYKLHTMDKTGRSLILNVAVAPLRSVSNEQTGAIIVIENVTSRVKLEESLQQSEKLSSIGLLAAGVAHEVNTPLTGVSSYTQMLLGMIPETDPKHALLQKMQRQTDRATNIVGNLLNFSRTGSVLESYDVDVHKLLDDTIQLLEPQLRKSNVGIERDYAADPSHVYGDAGKLQQVFTNLILNARDAIVAGGRIELTTSSGDGDEVIVEVRDHGKGIPAENLQKIFDPFFTTKGVGNGTGLGLAVTYGIVQEHGGSIEVTSDPSAGTCFRIAFPEASKIRKRAVS